MPTESEIRAYAQALPPIYRDILTAFPEIEPSRGAGYGLAFQTLSIHLANQGRPHHFGDVREACLELAESGFMEIKNEIFAHPTELGEQLISAVSNRPKATTSQVPRLPQRTW